MSWKESSIVSERMKFIVRLEGGERMSDLCREFGISRKTGYKFLERYQEFGPNGLWDQSRKPERLARSMPQAIQELTDDDRLGEEMATQYELRGDVET